MESVSFFNTPIHIIKDSKHFTNIKLSESWSLITITVLKNTKSITLVVFYKYLQISIERLFGRNLITNTNYNSGAGMLARIFVMQIILLINWQRNIVNNISRQQE